MNLYMNTASHQKVYTRKRTNHVRMTCFIKQSYMVMQRETERERMGKREREGERMEKRDFILNMIAQPKGTLPLILTDLAC